MTGSDAPTVSTEPFNKQRSEDVESGGYPDSPNNIMKNAKWFNHGWGLKSWKVMSLSGCLCLVIFFLVFIFAILPPLAQYMFNHSKLEVNRVTMRNPQMGGILSPLFGSGDMAKTHKPKSDEEMQMLFERNVEDGKPAIYRRICVYCQDDTNIRKEQRELFVAIDPKGKEMFPNIGQVLRNGWTAEQEKHVSLHLSLDDANKKINGQKMPFQMGFPGRTPSVPFKTSEMHRVENTGMQSISSAKDHICDPHTNLFVFKEDNKIWYKSTTIECVGEDEIIVNLHDNDAVLIKDSDKGTSYRTKKTNVMYRLQLGQLAHYNFGHNPNEEQNFIVRWKSVVVVGVSTKKGTANKDESFVQGQSYPAYQVVKVGLDDRGKEYPPIQEGADFSKLTWVSAEFVELDPVRGDGVTFTLYDTKKNTAENADKLLGDAIGSIDTVTNVNLIGAPPLPAHMGATVAKIHRVYTDKYGYEQKVAFGKMAMQAFTTSHSAIDLPSTMYIDNLTEWISFVQPQLMGENVKLYLEAEIMMSVGFIHIPLIMKQTMELPGGAMKNIQGTFIEGNEFDPKSSKYNSLKSHVTNNLQMSDRIIVGDAEDFTQGLGGVQFDMYTPMGEFEEIPELEKKVEALQAYLNLPNNREVEELRDMRYQLEEMNAAEEVTEESLQELTKKAFKKTTDFVAHKKDRSDPKNVLIQYKISVGAEGDSIKYEWGDMIQIVNVLMQNMRACKDTTLDDITSQFQKTPENEVALSKMFSANAKGEDKKMFITGPIDPVYLIADFDIVQEITLLGTPEDKRDLLAMCQLVPDIMMNTNLQSNCIQLEEDNKNNPHWDGFKDICPEGTNINFMLPSSSVTAMNWFNIDVVQSDMDLKMSWATPLNSYTVDMPNGSYKCPSNDKFSRTVPNVKVSYEHLTNVRPGKGTQINSENSDVVRVNAKNHLTNPTGLTNFYGPNVLQQQKSPSWDFCKIMTAQKYGLKSGFTCCAGASALASACRSETANTQHKIPDPILMLLQGDKKQEDNWNIWIQEGRKEDVLKEKKEFVKNLYADTISVKGLVRLGLGGRFNVGGVEYQQASVPFLAPRDLDLHVPLNMLSHRTCKDIHAF